MNHPDCREAQTFDAPAIAAIVNRAYRPAPGSGGWTHEAELVHGARTDTAQVEALLGQAHASMLLCSVDGRIAGCVHVERVGAEARIGMLAVDPALQAAGLGRRLLAAAEAHAAKHFGARTFLISVIGDRAELLAFYQRCGYVPTGESMPFPIDAGVGTPRGQPLELRLLAKPATSLKPGNSASSSTSH